MININTNKESNQNNRSLEHGNVHSNTLQSSIYSIDYKCVVSSMTLFTNLEWIVSWSRSKNIVF